MQINTIKLIFNDEIKDFKYYAFDEGTDILEIEKRFLKFEDRLGKYELKTNYGN